MQDRMRTRVQVFNRINCIDNDLIGGIGVGVFCNKFVDEPPSVIFRVFVCRKNFWACRSTAILQRAYAIADLGHAIVGLARDQRC